MCQNAGSGGGGTSKVIGRDATVITQSGDIADMGGKKLAYTTDDPTLSGARRTAIEEWETKRGKSKIEFAYMVDENGNMIAENRGGRGSVRTRVEDKMNSDTFTHIHPRGGAGEEGYLGGTFSLGDLENFTMVTDKGLLPQTKLRSYRAKATEGTYYIATSNGYNAKGLRQYARDLNAKLRTTLKENNSKADSEYREGKVDRTTYLNKRKSNFNQALVELHNGLLAGQKQYGYIYGLERKKK